MKTITTLLLSTCLCFSITVLAQEKEKINTNLDAEELSSLINKTYIKFSVGQENATSSSYAGLDLKETEFTFSPIYITKNTNVWNAKFKGGVTDGAASLFTNNKFNTNESVEIQYNLNLTKGHIQTVSYLEEDYIKYRTAKIDVLKKIFGELKTYAAKDETLKTKDYGTKIDEVLNKFPEKTTSKSLKEYEDTLMAKYKELQIEISDLTWPNDTQKEIVIDLFGDWNNRIADISKKRFNDFKYSQFTSQWLTFGGSIRNDEFRLLNRTMSFGDQIEKTNFVSYGAKIQFNYYQYSKYGNSWFYSFGLNYKRKSNFASLKKVDITETVTVGTDGQSVRNSNDKFVAYEGDYKEDLNQLDASAELFYFVNKFQNIGFHIYENSRFLDFVKPSHDLGLGVVFPFKNKAKETTIINAELYYTLKNIFNTKGTTFGLLERNDIGLRFTFPIDFNNN